MYFGVFRTEIFGVTSKEEVTDNSATANGTTNISQRLIRGYYVSLRKSKNAHLWAFFDLRKN
jgi:hypothetical protein